MSFPVREMNSIPVREMDSIPVREMKSIPVRELNPFPVKICNFASSGPILKIFAFLEMALKFVGTFCSAWRL